jgi:hypothetical protein
MPSAKKSNVGLGIRASLVLWVAAKLRDGKRRSAYSQEHSALSQEPENPSLGRGALPKPVCVGANQFAIYSDVRSAVHRREALI